MKLNKSKFKRTIKGVFKTDYWFNYYSLEDNSLLDWCGSVFLAIVLPIVNLVLFPVIILLVLLNSIEIEGIKKR